MKQIIIYFIGLLLLASCQYERLQGSSKDFIPYKNKKGKWGYLDSISKKNIIPCKFDKAYPFLNNSAIIGVRNENYELRYGVIDTLGNLVLPIEHDIISFPINGYYITYKKDKGKGVFSLKGEQIVPCTYSRIEMVEDTFSIVEKENKFGCYNLIDKKEILPCQYDKITIFTNQILSVEYGNKVAYFDKTGKALTPFKYDFAGDFSDGLAAVSVNGKYGYIDTTGNEKIPIHFDYVHDFNDGMAVVEWKNKKEIGIINADGKIVYYGKYGWIGLPHASSGLMPFCTTHKSGWGFINEQGKLVIPFMYDYLPEFGFNGDYALVEDWTNEENKYAIINKHNELIYPFTTDYRYSIVSDSLIVVFNTKTSKSKLVNARKKEIIPYKYTNIETYNDHFFKVRQDSLYGLIDREGIEVLHPEYMEIGQFQNGMALVRKSEYLIGFVNELGSLAISCKYDYYNNKNTFFKSGFAYIKEDYPYREGYIDKQGNEYWIEGGEDEQ
jgi:hypothetical protein